MHRILKIGMDVHTKNYTLCAVEPILGQEENILAQLQVAPSHTFVLDFIKSRMPKNQGFQRSKICLYSG